MPPPTRHTRWPQTYCTSPSLLPVPMAASRSINWSFGKRGEAPDPPIEIGVFEGKTLALDELDDFAVAEVD